MTGRNPANGIKSPPPGQRQRANTPESTTHAIGGAQSRAQISAALVHARTRRREGGNHAHAATHTHGPVAARTAPT
eukprot:5690331-Prymnesium_polylepis.1